MSTLKITNLTRQPAKNGSLYAKITGSDGRQYIAGRYSYDKTLGIETGDTVDIDSKPSTDGSSFMVTNIRKVSSGGENPTPAGAGTSTAPSPSAPAGGGDRSVAIEMQTCFKIAGHAVEWTGDETYVNTVASTAKALYAALQEAKANPT
jgi:hypothetical protein